MPQNKISDIIMGAKEKACAQSLVVALGRLGYYRNCQFAT
jgi:hypothetical protein